VKNMKRKTSSNVSFPTAGRNAARSAALLMAVTFVATVAAPLAVRAQLNYLGGTAEIEFDGEPVALYGGGPPLWVGDTFTGGNDILSSPGGGFNEVNYAANAPVYNSGVVGLGGGVAAGLGAGVYGGVPYGGGVVAATPTWIGSAVGEVAPGAVSANIVAESSTFNVGAAGLPATIGTYLSIGGILNPNSAIGASLVTYITDNTTATTEILAEVLGATGINSGNTVALSGTLGAPAALNAWVAYGVPVAGVEPYAGFSAASVNNFIAPFDNVTITAVLTEAADPDATIDSEPVPANLDGVTLPGDILMGTEVPEPGALSLIAAGLSALQVFRKRSCA
jgi:hypothetical protein